MIDQERVPALLRQHRDRGLRVRHRRGAGAPLREPPRQQRGLDRARRRDQHSGTGEIGRREGRRVVLVAAGGFARQRHRHAEGRSGARHALDPDAAAHARDDALADGEAEAGAGELARRAAIGLLELAEDALLRVGRDADTGVAHRDGNVVGPDAGFHHEGDAAALGELDAVAGEIEQHLAQPHRIADHAARQRVIEIGRDLEALALRPRRQELDRLLDQRRQIERPRLEIEPAGLDLGEIENFLDQRRQRLARGLHRLGIGRLLGRERGIEQQIGHADDAVERRANLVRHHGQEPRFGAAGGFRLVARLAERVLGGHPIGDVAADALQLGARLCGRAHQHVAPRDPARAVAAGDLLVMRTGAVRHDREVALHDHVEPEGLAEQRFARRPRQRAKGVVGVGDAPLAVAPDDDVALRLEKALGALLGLLELPIAVAQLLDPLAQCAPLRAQDSGARPQQPDRPAGRSEHGGRPDREQIGVIMRARIAGAPHESERGRKRHRQQYGAPDHDRDQAADAQAPEDTKHVGINSHAKSPAKPPVVSRELRAAKRRCARAARFVVERFCARKRVAFGFDFARGRADLERGRR